MNKLNTPTQVLSFEILNIIEFTSSRKRMSVIVRDESGQIKVLTKGADSVLSQMLGPVDMDTLSGRLQNAIRENTAIALQEHATEGLRTLLICEKVISEGAYEDWLAKYK